MRASMLSLVILGLVTGCDSGSTFPTETPTEAPETGQGARVLAGAGASTRNGAAAFTDPETGCEYIVMYDKGIAPRMELFMGSYIHRGCKDRVTIN